MTNTNICWDNQKASKTYITNIARLTELVFVLLWIFFSFYFFVCVQCLAWKAFIHILLWYIKWYIKWNNKMYEIHVVLSDSTAAIFMTNFWIHINVECALSNCAGMCGYQNVCARAHECLWQWGDSIDEWKWLNESNNLHKHTNIFSISFFTTFITIRVGNLWKKKYIILR